MRRSNTTRCPVHGLLLQWRTEADGQTRQVFRSADNIPHHRGTCTRCKLDWPVRVRNEALHAAVGLAKSTACTLTLLVSWILPAAAAGPVTSPVTEQFAHRCMANLYRPQGLIQQMQEEGALLLDGQAAKFFLTNKPGIAWNYMLGDDSYVVALRDDGICATFVRDESNLPAVEAAFRELAGTAPAPLVATPLPPEPYGPNGEGLTTIAYSWAQSGAAPALLFVLTTSREDQPLVRAMISLSRVAPPAAPTSPPR